MKLFICVLFAALPLVCATTNHAGTMTKIAHDSGLMTVYGAGVTLKIVEQCKSVYGSNAWKVNQCVQSNIGTAAYPAVSSRQRIAQPRRAVSHQSNSIDPTIMARCQKKWGNDYRMVKYCVDLQTKAKSDLGY